MEPVTQNVRLVQRAYWLINLRWIATVCVGAATFVSGNILNIALQETALYIIAVLLAVYNLAVFLLLKHFGKSNHEISRSAVKKIINFQVSADLIILTVLLHFSGGIENPFIFYFAFHMIISSILLSVKESYLHATLAVLLFGFLLILEYTDIIEHYCLRGFVANCMHRDGNYLIGTYFVFVSCLYLMVYMGSYIAIRLKNAEQAYREANTQLLEKDRIKDEYVLRVTHDIKGHLAAIKSCLDVVINRLVGPLNDQQADFVSRAHNRTNKVTNFVRMLLKLTRMHLSHEFEKNVFSLKNTIVDVVTAIKSRAEDKSITLTYNIDGSVGDIFGNQFSIEEAIMNLLLNGIKYTPANGSVEINARVDGEHMMVEVVDSGMGIPQEELPKIFDEFYRATNAKKSETDGTGLGTSIVKQIIERHNGRIWVESEENVGTKFSFTVPIRAAQEVEE